MESIKILIADDHVMIANALSSMLNNSAICEVVSVAHSVDDLLEQAKTQKVDVFIVDLGFKGTVGDVGIIDVLRKVKPEAKIIICSMRSNLHTIKACYKLGALAFVNKDSNPDDLIKAVERAGKGERYFIPSVLAQVGEAWVDDPLEGLSERERKVFMLFVEGASMEEVIKEVGLSKQSINNLINDRIKPVVGTSRSGFKEAARKMGLIEYID